MAYTYGKKFKKDGQTVQYRYTNKDKSTKKLVYSHNKKSYYDSKMKSRRRSK